MQGHELMEQETSKFTNDILKIRDKFVTDGMIVKYLPQVDFVSDHFFNKVNYRLIMRAFDHALSKLMQHRVCLFKRKNTNTCYCIVICITFYINSSVG